MTDDGENLILEPLRVIRAGIATVKIDIREIKQRLTSLEAGSDGIPLSSMAMSPTNTPATIG